MKAYLLITSLLFSLNIMGKTVKLKAKYSGRKDVKVYLPKTFEKQEKWPLIISMHGYGGSSLIQNYYVRLNKFKNKFGYVFAAPNGLKDSAGKGYWNATNFCCDFEKKKIDDVAYIKGLIDEIKNSNEIGRIDPEKIYLIGYSNGAFLASKIACSNSVKVAGMVNISGTSDLRNSEGELLAVDIQTCEHERAVPFLHVHGTADETIKYEGTDNGKTGHVGAIDHIKRWANQNGCRGEFTKKPSKLNASNFIKGKDTDHFVVTDCLAPVEHYRINEGVHFGIFKKSFTKNILEFLFRK